MIYQVIAKVKPLPVISFRGLAGLNLTAGSRDDAIKQTRAYYRKRGMRVKQIVSARAKPAAKDVIDTGGFEN